MPREDATEPGRAARLAPRYRQRGRGLHGWLVDELGQFIVDCGPDVEGGPDPVAIAGQFGVSRTVVREALRALEAKGLVTARPNVGTRLRPQRDWNLFDPQVIDWRLHGKDTGVQMRELLELRTAIEPFAARLAAQRVDATTRTSLEQARDALVRAFEEHDIGAFTRADIELHASLLTASGNEMIAQLANVVAEALRAREEVLRNPENVSGVAVRLHVEVVDAVVSADAAQAEARMRDLLAEVSHVVAQAAGDSPE